MLGTGLFTALYGMGYFWNVHEFWFYAGVQVLAGLFQSTGWPSVVSVMGQWFGKGKRGLIMGIWNAHTSSERAVRMRMRMRMRTLCTFSLCFEVHVVLCIKLKLAGARS